MLALTFGPYEEIIAEKACECFKDEKNLEKIISESFYQIINKSVQVTKFNLLVLFNMLKICEGRTNINILKGLWEKFEDIEKFWRSRAVVKLFKTCVLSQEEYYCDIERFSKTEEDKKSNLIRAE